MSENLSPFVSEGNENFADLLEESFNNRQQLTGQVVKGIVIAIENDAAVIDVGLKSEGRVPLMEFANQDQPADINVGDLVEVFIEQMENRNGEAVLSHERARREESWKKLEVKFNNNERVDGVIFGRVRGGYTVDLDGAVAFLPGSQVDVRPIKDITPLMGHSQPFQLLKMDRARGNIVVSRRVVLEETREEQRKELITTLEEGQELDGVIKNITNYGAFVDLGGVDGLLHVTDISWKRINHPSEVINVGDTVRVQIIRFNSETQRVSLGMKQLESDPWHDIGNRYPLGKKVTGKVTNIADYGAFIELENGIEGLVHVSEMSWVRKNIHPGKILSSSQEVEVVVLEVDQDRRRISLGLKQCQENPWEVLFASYPIDSIVEGEVRNITDFGLFIGLTEEIDGMVHMSDLDWSEPSEEVLKNFNKGDMVKAKVLNIDTDKQRISLGIKQLTEQPEQKDDLGEFKKGQVVTCRIIGISAKGIQVKVNDDIEGFISKNDLSSDRSEQRPDRFAVDEKVDAKITQVDRSSNRLKLSIKAYETAIEKEAMSNYGSSESGASLGDILGAALQEKQEQQTKDADKDETVVKKAAAKKSTTKKASAKKATAKKDDAKDENDKPEDEATAEAVTEE